MKEQNTGLGVALMAATTFLFAVQDGISRHLAENYNVLMIVTVRYWFFALFVMAMVARMPGGLRAALNTAHPRLQIFRGLLLAAEICVIVVAFVRLGLIETHAIFVTAPLIVAALSGPLLGEKVGWRRWSAIGVGFIGVLIVLRPGSAVFSPLALLPFISAVAFALYAILTRYVGRKDAAGVSFFWTGIVGAVAMTPFGLWHWEPMSGTDWLWMLALAGNACLAHYLYIRAYEVAEASAVQPFAYLQLPIVAVIGMTFFGDTLTTNIVIGAAIVVAAGLFTLWREQQVARAKRLSADRR